MAWWNKKVVFPVKRALVAVAARVKARKHGDGISKLHDDVRTCGYQDVQVMWEMLRRSETELPKQRKRRFWRPSASSRRTTSCDSMERHHHRASECECECECARTGGTRLQ